MAKSPEFYPRFIQAIFTRGKAEALPMSYIDTEAERMLNTEERETFYTEFEALKNAGKIKEKDGGFAWTE